MTTACSTELEEVTDGGGRDGGACGVRGVLAVLRHQATPSTGGLHREGEGVEADQRDTSDDLRAAQNGGDSRGRRRTAKASRVRVSAFWELRKGSEGEKRMASGGASSRSWDSGHAGRGR